MGEITHRSTPRKPAYVYILKCRDGSLYVGWTTDVQARLAKHADGAAAKYTRSRRPLTLVYSEPHESKSAALKRERQIKSWTRVRKEALVLNAEGADAAAVPGLRLPARS